MKIKHIRLKERYGEGEIPHETKTGTGPILLTSDPCSISLWFHSGNIIYHHFNIHSMIDQPSLVALFVIAAVILVSTIVGLLAVSIPGLAQNVTVGNITGGNSTEGATTTESERGPYSDYGGGN